MKQPRPAAQSRLKLARAPPVMAGNVTVILSTVQRVKTMDGVSEGSYPTPSTEADTRAHTYTYVCVYIYTRTRARAAATVSFFMYD